jgi:hypothetical protein
MFVADKPPASFPCNAASDPTVADAICDRLLHPAHRVVLEGPSRRKEASPDS